MIGAANASYPHDAAMYFDTTRSQHVEYVSPNSRVAVFRDQAGKAAMWDGAAPGDGPNYHIDDLAPGTGNHWGEPRPIIHFTEETNFLTEFTGGGAGTVLSQPLHMFAYYFQSKQPIAGSPVRHWEEEPLSGASTRFRFRTFVNNDGEGINLNAGKPLRSYHGSDQGKTVMTEGVYNGTESKVYIDGVQKMVSSTGFGNLAPTADAGSNDLITFRFGFLSLFNIWGAMVWFQGEKTGQAQQEIRDQLTTRWGNPRLLTVTL